MDAPTPDGTSTSPRWNGTTKLVFSLTAVALVAWLLSRFQNVIGPIILALLLAYLMYPAATWVRKWSRMSWRLTVTILFLLTVIVVLGLTTLGGIAVVDQAQSLVKFLQRALTDLPDLLQRWSERVIVFGPYTFQLNLTEMLNLDTLSQDLLGMIQPVLSRTGTLLGAIASGAVNFVGMFFFVVLVGYFILAESGGFQNRILNLNLPGYNEDIQRLGRYLGDIWNSFLRGQLTIILITIIVYIIMLGILGTRYALGLAVLAGMARFVPYLGTTIAWTVYGLVAFFQESNIFGLSPIGYVILVVAAAWLVDLFLDNFVSTRLMGTALKLHPAIILIAALAGASLLGLAGVVLAAPVAATVKLFFAYVFNKLLDRNPWDYIHSPSPAAVKPLRAILGSLPERAMAGLRKLVAWIQTRIKTR